MNKQKSPLKRKASSLPKGLPLKRARHSLAGGTRSTKGGGDDGLPLFNPFENHRTSKTKAAKFQVHNRSNHNPSQSFLSEKKPVSTIARALQSRKEGLRAMLQEQKKAGAFIDRRIGESRHRQEVTLSHEERMLARVVRERALRSKRSSRFQLQDEEAHHLSNEDLHHGSVQLTHRGKSLVNSQTGRFNTAAMEDVLLSSDDEVGGVLGPINKVDTEMHFGGGQFDQAKRQQAKSNPYGPSSTNGDPLDLGDVYRSRKQDLDELIAFKKREKAEKTKSKEQQYEKFEEMDASFHELAGLLEFRDKELERRQKADARKNGNLLLSEEDQEMEEWDKEMKEYLFERKVKATDRTKTPEEIAKEEADKLNELESRRLARMNGDFDDDDLSDISDQENVHAENKNEDRAASRREDRKNARRKKRASKQSTVPSRKNPDELDSDDDGNPSKNDEVELRFSGHDGLVYTDRNGNIVRRNLDNAVSTEDDSDDDDSSSNSDVSDEDGKGSSTSEEADSDGSTDDENDEDSHMDSADLNDPNDEDTETNASDDVLDDQTDFSAGVKVWANYRADEQFDGRAAWYKGTITKVYKDVKSSKTIYDIEYDDGDKEEGVRSENIKAIKEKEEDADNAKHEKNDLEVLERKRLKAKERARNTIPYVFEIPTTLEALHEIIAQHATCGKDASLIIHRIHVSNSLRINKGNKEKMQNFYDVLLRRFIAVGDSLYKYGDGGPELERYCQLDELTKTLYAISQESPEIAAPVWARRLGILQKAFAKRLRDYDLISDEDDSRESVWPSMGTILLLRALGHIFPVTDMRHVVVTPALLLIGQYLAQTPVCSMGDLIRGLFLTGLMVEYTREAKRVTPESFAFLAGALGLYASDVTGTSTNSPIPSLKMACHSPELRHLRRDAIRHIEQHSNLSCDEIKLPLESSKIGSSTALAVLVSLLHLVEKVSSYYNDALNDAESEMFFEIMRSLQSLHSTSTGESKILPSPLGPLVNKVKSNRSAQVHQGCPRIPLLRRSRLKANQLSLQTLAPRMEDPSRYSMSKDVGKDREQAQRDRMRREYKRDHKAVSRELRLDAAFIESERRKEKEEKDTKARNERYKNYNWLMQEQTTLNQQVAQGGGLLKGGGIGAARAKVATGKVGIKKGGKFR